MAGVPRSCSLQWLEGLARQCAPLPAPCQKWGPKEAGFQTGNLLQMKSKQQQDLIHRLRYPDRQLPFCLAGEKGQGWPGIKSRSLPCSPDQGQDKQMVSSKIRDRSEPKHVRLEESEAKRQRHKPRKMISWNPGDCFSDQEICAPFFVWQKFPEIPGFRSLWCSSWRSRENWTATGKLWSWPQIFHNFPPFGPFGFLHFSWFLGQGNGGEARSC